MTIRGLTGELRCGYQVVARLGSWTREGARVETTAREVNEFWLDQASRLDLRLDVGRRQWQWRGVDLIDSNRESFVVRVHGSPELL